MASLFQILECVHSEEDKNGQNVDGKATWKEPTWKMKLAVIQLWHRWCPTTSLNGGITQKTATWIFITVTMY